MRGGTLAGVMIPVAGLVLWLGGSPDAQPPAEASAIDRALAQAERDLARAEAEAGRNAI